jgi:hypothetical protein
MEECGIQEKHARFVERRRRAGVDRNLDRR